MGLVTATSINNDLRPGHRVIGYYLYDEAEQEIADIRDVLVDEESRLPRYLVIEVGGLLGVRGHRILVPWGVVTAGGMSRLDIRRSFEEVMGAPLPSDWLAPTRTEEESIHWFFQVEPYWLSEEDDTKGDGSSDRP